MLRKIWQRAAALALPVTLAICLPPLAVIALNLHAEATAQTRTHVTAPAHRTTNVKRVRSSGKAHVPRQGKPALSIQPPSASDRNFASNSSR